MTWHIVCLDEETDIYNVKTSERHFVLPVPLHHPTHPNAIGNNMREALAHHHLFPSEEAVDLLQAAIAVYTADVRVLRSKAFDNWTRDFILHLPVRQTKLWESAAPTIEKMLSFLTGDHWKLEIRKTRRAKVKRPTEQQSPTFTKKVSLFSGGLDSFAGAIDLLTQQEPVILVSHYTVGPLSEVQKQVYTLLDKTFPLLSKHLRFYVQPPKSSTKQTELTTRSRSILFMSLAAAAASALGEHSTLYVPENGLISLNVPLTHTRTSSLSTRTTHPYFINLFQTVLGELGLGIQVETPYQFFTKGEMLASAKHQTLLRRGAPFTMSCSHPGVGRHVKGGNPYQHCGYCVPCIIRRASMSTVGLDSGDPYGIDILTDPPSSERGTGRDFRAFEMALQRMAVSDFNPLLEVLNSGPLLGNGNNLAAYVGVFQRGMEEVRRFLTNGGK